MKSSLEAPEKQIAEETTAKPAAPAPVIDTSKMSAGKAAALELAESSRDPLDERGSFASNLFIGRYDFDRIYPWPEQSAEDRAEGQDFLADLEKYLKENIDADEIDRTGEIPQKNIDDLFAMGAFGVKIPKQYEGLGLSQVNYGRAAMLLGSWDENLTALVSAHQSIGVPQPLLLFGTDEQKKKYLPRVARKEISAFALTEWNAGSDPANMSLRADPAEDGSAFILNGEKLWCTNLIKAGVLVVMAKTAPKIVNDKERKQITAFIVDVDSPGLEITYRCRFMGLRALYNGIVKFTNVRVPRENMIAKEGQGLKVALTTLNTGRLTIPAACVGLSKRLLEISRKGASERFLRDCRINTIFEGSSEIMRLFIAREALDPHLKVGGAIFNTTLPMSERLKAVFTSGKFYAGWYPRQWFSTGAGKIDNLHRDLQKHLDYAARASKKLARGLFHAMARFGPKLDREQLLLSRFVGIATELFAISATCSFAQYKMDHGEAADEVLSVANYFCRSARARIDHHFAGTRRNADKRGYQLTQELLAGKHSSLREGIVQ